MGIGFAGLVWSLMRATLCYVVIAMVMCGGTVRAEAARLQILTSFSPAFYEPFISKFNTLYPDIQVAILNKKTTSAIDELLRGNSRQFDIFWSSSPDAFEILKSSMKLRSSALGRQHSTIAVDGYSVDDPDGYFYGFALSGVGWMWNHSYFRKEGLKPPQNWLDMANPAYYNHMAMSTPSHSGSTHLIVESLLQGMGWEKGWAHLMRMSGNLVTLSARSFSVTEGVKNGQFGMGLVIDILGRPQGVTHTSFQYGEPVFLSAASIAALRNSANSAEAELFIDFVLSPEGQNILLKPEINRLPVSQSMYESGKLDSFELLNLIKAGKSRPYDAYTAQLRYNLINRLFDELITFRLPERRRIWKRLISLEKSGDGASAAVREQVYRLLGEVPVSEAQSRDPEYNKMFASPVASRTAGPELQGQITLWQNFVEERLSRAKELLDSIPVNK
ncbi:extracellular solute-binding protein [Desulfovibrio mangrovi]|uniref:ABC transporter substrate-binding protein n=1 Tax=Desulfovibrio mangrovi TaxID=2976983 RepID=UPI002245B29A|nr:extracellular solute-binding protein [Desulfovibrio mangrovi]UZP67579.1 extracellular solute-binding protein [Desulfovibrio mangrovi]